MEVLEQYNTMVAFIPSALWPCRGKKNQPCGGNLTMKRTNVAIASLCMCVCLCVRMPLRRYTPTYIFGRERGESKTGLHVLMR